MSAPLNLDTRAHTVMLNAGLIDTVGNLRWDKWQYLEERDLRRLPGAGVVTTRAIVNAIREAGILLPLPLSRMSPMTHAHALVYCLGSALEEVTAAVTRARQVVSVADAQTDARNTYAGLSKAVESLLNSHTIDTDAVAALAKTHPAPRILNS